MARGHLHFAQFHHLKRSKTRVYSSVKKELCTWAGDHHVDALSAQDSLDVTIHVATGPRRLHIRKRRSSSLRTPAGAPI